MALFTEDDSPAPFADRYDAGRQLAERLAPYRFQDVVVLGLPRGGVIVGAPLAAALHAPLDVIVVRKMGAPSQPELGFGAVAEGGIRYVDERAVDHLRLSREQIERIADECSAEVDRLVRLYRTAGRVPVRGRIAIVVDDGLATGATAMAAVAAVRSQCPAKVVLAVPVCAAQSAEMLRTEVDDLVCVLRPHCFQAVGAWYTDFSQTSNDEVTRTLASARQALQPAPAVVR